VPPSDELCETFPFLKVMTRRQLELLYLLGVRELPEKIARVTDISQNFGFASITEGRVPCITPKGMKFVTSRCRLILGYESLRYQGMWFDDRNTLTSFEDELLQDLAGNAFEVTSYAAVVWSTLVFRSRNFARRRRSQDSEATASAASINDDNDLDEIWGLSQNSSASGSSGITLVMGKEEGSEVVGMTAE
jgi:hypothetical protein